ncbi:MAG: adenosylcobinamide-phosphate synthase CbiB [Pseudomonadota bacterium]
MTFALTMALALLLDWLFGWPQWLYDRIGHPVTWIGRLISELETRLNLPDATRSSRMLAGAVSSLFVVLISASAAFLLQVLLPDGMFGMVLGAVLAWPLLAARSLHDHVADVQHPLAAGNVERARDAVSRIVGRDPAKLDEAGIARSAIESLAENTSDGVTAPLFWGVLFGLPGIAAYKAVNTLDSMIGYRNERYEAYGKLAARLDDLVNWIPARLTGVCFVLVAQDRQQAWQVMRRDAGLHRSPNAGWPEAAMAAALNCRLSGPRSYGDRLEQHPWVNDGAPDPDAATIGRALAMLKRCLAMIAGLLVVLAVLD